MNLNLTYVDEINYYLTLHDHISFESVKYNKKNKKIE